MRATASFITGYPDEEQADQDQTLDLIGSCFSRCHDDLMVQLHLLTPEPGTTLLAEHGDQLSYDGHVSDFNFPTLEPDDDELMRDHVVDPLHGYRRRPSPGGPGPERHVGLESVRTQPGRGRRARPARLPRHSLGMAEGFYLSHIVYFLHRRGVLEQLRGPATVSSLADEHGFDMARLRGALEYVSRRTDILLDTPDGENVLNPEYADYHRLGFHLDKFIGAYGGLARGLDESLRGTARGCRGVDEQLLAEAFTRAGRAGVEADAYVLGQWNVRCLLDLGCGPAALLIHLAVSNPEFRGWGVDQSQAMCDVAAARVSDAGLAHAVNITPTKRR